MFISPILILRIVQGVMAFIAMALGATGELHTVRAVVFR